MIDAAARTAIHTTIADFLCDRLTSLALEKRLLEIRGETSDKTVQHFLRLSWELYDGDVDHFVTLDKRTWDAVQRWMLVLESRSEVDVEKRWLWHSSQFIAGACLVVQVWAYWLCPEAWPIPIVVGGPISFALWHWRTGAWIAAVDPDPWLAWPFRSPTMIARALKRAPGFRKRRLPPYVAARLTQGVWHRRADGVLFLIYSCAASPMSLLIECWPLRIERVVVHEPDDRVGQALRSDGSLLLE